MKKIYTFTIANVFGEQDFIWEDEEIVNALMKAVDVAAEIDRRINQKIDWDDGEVISKVLSVTETATLRPDEAGIEEFVSSLDIVNYEED